MPVRLEILRLDTSIGLVHALASEHWISLSLLASSPAMAINPALKFASGMFTMQGPEQFVL